MLNKLILSTLILLSSCIAWAQEGAHIVWGEELVLDKKTGANKLIGSQGDYFYVINSSVGAAENSAKVYLDIFDHHDLNRIERVELIGIEGNTKYEKLMLVNGQLLLFISEYDRELQSKIVYGQYLDERGNFDGKRIRVDEIALSEKEDPRTHSFVASPDQKSLLVYHENPLRDDFKRFNLKVLDTNLASVWEKEIKLNFREKNFRKEQLLVDDYQNVYLLAFTGLINTHAALNYADLVNSKKVLYAYHHETDRLQEFEFSLSNKWIRDVRMTIDKNGYLLAAGLYTSMNDFMIKGLVYFKLGLMYNEVINQKLIYFSSDHISRLTALTKNRYVDGVLLSDLDQFGYDQLASGNAAVNNYRWEFDFKDMNCRSSQLDLHLELVKEVEVCYEYTSPSITTDQIGGVVGPGGGYQLNCTDHFYYLDIIGLQLNAAGDLTAFSQVPKSQHSVKVPGQHYSFGVVYSGDRQGYLFNDHEDNLPYRQGRTKSMAADVSTIKNSYPVFVATGTDWSPGQEAYLFEEDTDPKLVPRLVHQLDNSHHIIYARKEKSYMFGKIILE